MKPMPAFGVAAVALIGLAVTSASASWLSDITGVNIDVPAGRFSLSAPRPQDIPAMIQHLPNDAANFFLNPAGPALAFEIRQAYAQAHGSAQLMPAEMKALLSPYFPPVILNSALYTTRSQAGTSLPTILEGSGQIGAITLDNIIVFTSDDQANDYGVWAHELTHVGQYRNLGIDGFAALYAGPGAIGLENDAYSWQNHVVADIRSRGGGPSAVGQQWVDTSGPAPPPGTFAWNVFNTAARQVIPANQCGQWAQIAPNAIQISNICPTSILVTFIDENGMHRACQGPVCFFPPGNSHVIAGSDPGQVQLQGIWFNFTN